MAAKYVWASIVKTILKTPILPVIKEDPRLRHVSRLDQERESKEFLYSVDHEYFGILDKNFRIMGRFNALSFISPMMGSC